MITHRMLIQSAYADRGLSERRLKISFATSVPSLKAQTSKPIVHLVVNEADPLLNRRLEAFASTGCVVHIMRRDCWRLYGENWELPEGRKLVGRMDDDDIISDDFCETVQAESGRTGEWAMAWPGGYVLWNNEIYFVRHLKNPFVTLLTDRDFDPHKIPHTRFHKEWPTHFIERPGWMWVRHGDAVTPTLPRYRRYKINNMDRERFTSFDSEAVRKAIMESGPSATRYW